MRLVHRLGRLTVPVFVVTSLVLSVGGAHAATPEQARIVQLVNVERATYDLAPLAWDPRLAESAEGYSLAMATANFFSHTGVDGSRMVGRNEIQGYLGWSFLGENLAAGQESPERVVNAWMRSPTHRANVLASEACDIGIGHAYAAASAYRNYWSMEVGCAG